MSVHALAKALKVRGLSPLQKLLVVHLADRCQEVHPGHEGRSVCWPSLSRLADDLEVSRRYLITSMSELEKAGLLVRVRDAEPFPGYTGATTLYELLPAQPASDPQITSDAQITTPASDPQITTPSDPQITPLVIHRSPKPIREPKSKPQRALVAGATARKAPATLLPDDFPLEEDKAKALRYWQGRGRTDLDMADEVFRFRNHHTSNGTRMVSWPAAWATWYANAIRYRRAPLNASGGSAAMDYLREAATRGAE